MELIVFSLVVVATLFFAIVMAKYIWIAITAFLRLVWSMAVIAGLVFFIAVITDPASVSAAIEYVYRMCPACMDQARPEWNSSITNAA
ncbi:MAG: hypothetical protein OXI17_11320 [Gammaproteobacteria bacterium]|nr:hypothetical protein [Gammaproteobacteria bacterium]